MTSLQQVTILLVEDDPGHARLIEKNLRRANLTNPIVILGDGQQAIDYLFGPESQQRVQPTSPLLMLLDLNLPGLDGYQVLRRMKENKRTQSIPVVVLTTTDDEREVKKSYDLGCNLYVTKPVEYDQFCEIIQRLGMCLAVVKIPSGA